MREESLVVALLNESTWTGSGVLKVEEGGDLDSEVFQIQCCRGPDLAMVSGR